MHPAQAGYKAFPFPPPIEIPHVSRRSPREKCVELPATRVVGIVLLPDNDRPQTPRIKPVRFRADVLPYDISDRLPWSGRGVFRDGRRAAWPGIFARVGSVRRKASYRGSARPAFP